MKGRRPVRHDARPNATAPPAHDANTECSNGGIIWKMANVHDCAVVAKGGIAINHQITAAMASHVTQSEGRELSERRQTMITHRQLMAATSSFAS
jgi:hypothetical protein